MGNPSAEIKGEVLPDSDSWKPELHKYSTILPVAALLGVIACSGLSVCILVQSNDKVVGEWPISGAPVQPTVFLSLFASISGVLLGIAISKGTTIAWWRKALGGASVEDLSRSYDMAKSGWSAATSGRHFNRIAFACLMATAMIAEGPLLQKASSVVSNTKTRPTTLGVHLAPAFTGYTAYTDYNGLALWTPAFVKIMQAYNSQTPIQQGLNGCTGTCNTTVKAFGFAVNCSSHNVPTVIYPLPNKTVTLDAAGMPFQLVFNSTFEFQLDAETDTTVVGFHWKGLFYQNNPLNKTNETWSANCKGTTVTKQCTLVPATVNYDLNISKETVTLQNIDRPLTVDTVIPNFYDGFPSGEQGGSTLTALFQLTNYLYSAHGKVQYDQGYPAPVMEGPLSPYYINNHGLSALDTSGACNNSWNDPLPDIMKGLNEITFRIAAYAELFRENTGLAPGVDPPQPPTPATQVAASEEITHNVFHSDYKYLAAALAVVVFCVFGVSLIFFAGEPQEGSSTELLLTDIARVFCAPDPLTTRYTTVGGG